MILPIIRPFALISGRLRADRKLARYGRNVGISASSTIEADNLVFQGMIIEQSRIAAEKPTS
jgi:hypothetical protein